MQKNACGFVLEDRTHAHWPGLPKYRTKYSKTAYRTRQEAADRAERITHWAAAKYGAAGGPDLRVIEASCRRRR
jgi:hypothetical protein